MNPLLSIDGAECWQIAGWTMLHFLWMGTLVCLAAMVGRLLVRRASAETRYAAALMSLFVLAALPLGIAAWLIARAPLERPAVAEAPPANEIIELKDRAPMPIGASAPDSARGFAANNTVTQKTSQSDVALTNSRQSRGLTDLLTTTPAAWVPYLPWLWLVGTPLTFVLLATGIVGAERLRRASRAIEDGPLGDACARLRKSLGISRRVTVAVCERIAAPVLVGILRPIILLPPAALTSWSPDEIEMVLLHELAHVRRWDNLVNLVQRLVESLLFFHPAVWWVSGWVRREREACCDAVVVHRTNRPHAYAEMLVALAAQMPRSVLFHPAATSAMAAGPLRARIRRILQLEDDPMLISGKPLLLMLGTLLVAGVLSVLYLPEIGQADESVPQANDGKEPAQPISAPTPADAHNVAELFDINPAEELSADDARDMAELFNSDDVVNPVETRSYSIAPAHQKSLEVTLNSFTDGPLRKHVRFKDKWDDKHANIEITAPKLALDGFFDPLIRVLESWNETKLAQRNSNNAGKTRNIKFPSLEDQKLADLAWKMLQLELEPINDEEMKRVKAMGYDGGVKVVKSPIYLDGIWTNDILLGLHVWPTTNLKQVAEILQRGDLAQLNPLKFYVVRPGAGKGQSGGFRSPEDDTVVTGRIGVRDSRERRTGAGRGASGFPGGQNSEPNLAPSTNPGPWGSDATANPFSAPPDQTFGAPERSILTESSSPFDGLKPQAAGLNRANLRYDGKTFDEWRQMWRTELSTERRLEAVKALAAFGAAGYGKEAAEAILEVVKQYDWTVIGQSPVSQLKNEAIRAFAGNGEGAASIAMDDWLPVLVDGIKSGNKRVIAFADLVIPDPNMSEVDIPRLIELSRDDSLKSVRFAILSRLQAAQNMQPDPRISERMLEVFEKEPEFAAIALPALYPAALSGSLNGMMGGGYMGGGYIPGASDVAVRLQAASQSEYRPQLLDLLEHGNPAVRSQVVSVLADLGPKAKPAVPRLLPLLLEIDQEAAVRLTQIIPSIAGSDEATEFLKRAAEKDKSPAHRQLATMLLDSLKPPTPTPVYDGKERGEGSGIRGGAIGPGGSGP